MPLLSLADWCSATASDSDKTKALAACLERCAQDGGGEIRIPAGRWPAGELRLASNVALRLDRGAQVLGGVVVENVQDVGVFGEDLSCCVDRLRCSRVERLRLEGFSGRAAAFAHCRGGVVRHLKLHEGQQRQGEGSALWLRYCHDFDLADLDLASNDDVFCIKNEASNIALRRSVLRGHLAAAYKIGTETQGVIKGITFEDSVIYHSDRAALSLEAVDGTHLRQVRIDNIRMVNVAAPLFVRLGNRDRWAAGVGSISGVSISRIDAIGMDLDEGYGSSITGIPGHPVRDITLSQIRLTYRGGGSRELACRTPPEGENLYPEYDMFGKLPAYGLYCRHVAGLVLRDVVLRFAEMDLRPALVCDDVEGLELDRFDAQAWPAARYTMRNDRGATHYVFPDDRPAGEPSIELRDARRVSIANSLAAFGVPMLRVRGGQSADISLRNVDLSHAAQPAVLVGQDVGAPIASDAPLVVGRVPPPVATAQEGRKACPSGRPAISLRRAGGHVSSHASLLAAVASAGDGDTIVVGDGRLELAPGEYPILIDKPGLTIRSEHGPAATQLVAIGANEALVADYDRSDLAASRSVSLLAVEADRVTIQGLTLSGALHNVLVANASECTIRDNHFDFAKRWHVWLRGGRGHRIADNRSRAAVTAIVKMDGCERCVIRGHASQEDSAGFRLTGCAGCRIEDCRFDGVSWWAVMLEAGCRDNVVARCQFLQGRMCGIQVRESRGTSVETSLFRGHKCEAILVDRAASDVRISRNRFEGNRGLAVSNETAQSVDAAANWWGSPAGPSGAGSGDGDMVDANVVWRPWLAELPWR